MTLLPTPLEEGSEWLSIKNRPFLQYCPSTLWDNRDWIGENL